ncbi:hypothetical protein [Methylobacterium mesophilicum]|uniref:hypothetical protein n=1 Tax=Methylobacterium mesophilicum TaxID=39956 RepID=UPI00177D8E21|nr:hypothetical protein [Methylobacterium mesophilicum]
MTPPTYPALAAGAVCGFAAPVSEVTEISSNVVSEVEAAWVKRSWAKEVVDSARLQPEIASMARRERRDTEASTAAVARHRE